MFLYASFDHTHNSSQTALRPVAVLGKGAPTVSDESEPPLGDAVVLGALGRGELLVDDQLHHQVTEHLVGVLDPVVRQHEDDVAPLRTQGRDVDEPGLKRTAHRLRAFARNECRPPHVGVVVQNHHANAGLRPARSIPRRSSGRSVLGSTDNVLGTSHLMTFEMAQPPQYSVFPVTLLPILSAEVRRERSLACAKLRSRSLMFSAS